MESMSKKIVAGTENKAEVRYLLKQSRNVYSKLWMNEFFLFLLGTLCYYYTRRLSVVDWGERKTMESS